MKRFDTRLPGYTMLLALAGCALPHQGVGVDAAREAAASDGNELVVVAEAGDAPISVSDMGLDADATVDAPEVGVDALDVVMPPPDMVMPPPDVLVSDVVMPPPDVLVPDVLVPDVVADVRPDVPTDIPVVVPDAGCTAGPVNVSGCPSSGGCSAAGQCVYASCAAAAMAGLPSGAYWLAGATSGPPWLGLCETNVGVAARSWTLVLKADGSTDVLAYEQAVWTDTNVLNAGAVNLNRGDAKFMGFMVTPVNDVRVQFFSTGATPTSLGEYLGQPTGVTLGRFAMHDLIVASPRVGLTGTRADWLGALAGSALQDHCNQIGLSQRIPDTTAGGVGVRIGILANNQDDCSSPDSWIGVGGAFYGSGGVSLNTGNAARVNGGGGTRDIVAQAYVWVR